MVSHLCVDRIFFFSATDETQIEHGQPSVFTSSVFLPCFICGLGIQDTGTAREDTPT